MGFNILIRGGSVYDGSGDRSELAVIGVEGALIAALGDLGDSRAATQLDATGLIVTTGFIDSHAHSELATWLRDMLLASPIG